MQTGLSDVDVYAKMSAFVYVCFYVDCSWTESKANFPVKIIKVYLILCYLTQSDGSVINEVLCQFVNLSAPEKNKLYSM